MASEIYICDTSSIFNLHENFSTEFKNKIGNFARNNALKIPEGVWREIKRKTDKIFKKIEKIIEKYPSIIVQVKNDQKIIEKLYEVERKYGEDILIGNQKYAGFWKSLSGKKAAEGQVVAIANVFGYIVVSDDNAAKLACMLENIPCIGWTEFARRLGLSHQQTLFNL
jgi:rRNA-processing protein FCF1